MLYNKYERKIKRLRRVRNTIIRYKALIICLVSFLLALTATLLSIKGVIVKDLTLSKTTFEYGEKIVYENPDSIFDTDYSIEFAIKDSDDWSTIEPTVPNDYKMRVVSSRAFGAKSYGAEHSFNITKKKVEISLLSSSLIYGDKPSLQNSSLVKGHSLSVNNVEFDFSDAFNNATVENDTFKGQVEINTKSVVILDKFGNDVASNYEIISEGKEIEFSKREVYLQSGSMSVFYAAKGHSNNSLSAISNTSFAFKDWATAEVDSFTEIGSYENKVKDGTVKIENAEYGDVTQKFYDVKGVESGEIIVNKRQVEFSFNENATGKTYDGTKTFAVNGKNEDYILAEGLLTDTGVEHTFTLSSIEYASANAGSTVLQMGELKIFDIDGNDVTDKYYETPTVINKEVEISKRLISIVQEGERSFEYNGQPRSWAEVNDLKYSSQELLAGHTIKIVENSELKQIDYTEKAVQNYFDIDIVCGEERVTENYQINASFGFIEITKKPLTVNEMTLTREYTGTSVYTETRNDDFKGLIDGHNASVSVDSQNSFVGSYSNLTPTIIIYDGGKNVSDNYSFDANNKVVDFSITQKTLYFTTSTSSRTYNAEAYSDGTFTTNGLVSGEVAVLKTPLDKLPSVTEVLDGEKDNVFEIEIMSGETVVTTNYDFASTTTYGKIKVTARKIKLTRIDFGKVYDATYNCQKQVECSDLVSDHVLTVKNGNSEHINAKEYATQITDENLNKYITITSGTTDVISNYSFDTTLTVYFDVSKRQVTFQAPNVEKTYDGSCIDIAKLKNITLVSGEIVSGQQPYLITTDSEFNDITITNYSESGKSYNYSIGIDNEEITKNYDITVNNGVLTINQRLISFTSLTPTKEYNANGKFSVASTDTSYVKISGKQDEGLVLDHILTINGDSNNGDADKYQVDIDTTKKAELIITSGTIDVTDNYKFDSAIIKAKLTITPKALNLANVNISDAERAYDGTPTFSYTGLTCVDLVDGQTINFTYECSNSIVGDYSIPYTANNSNNNGTLSIFSGETPIKLTNYAISGEIAKTFTIRQRNIYIYRYSAEKIYDATPLTCAQLQTYIGGEERATNVDSTTGLVKGHTLKFANEIPTITNYGVGGVRNNFEIDIYSGNQLMNDNYKRNYVECDKQGNPLAEGKYATLTIIKRNITFTTPSTHWIYDGEVHSDSSCTITELGLVNENGIEHIYKATKVKSITNVFDTLNKQDENNVFDITIYDKNDTSFSNSLNDNYNITCVWGTMRVDEREIYIKRISVCKVYDDEILQNGSYTYSKKSPLNEFIDAETLLVKDHRYEYTNKELPSIRYAVEGVNGEGFVYNDFELSVYYGETDLSLNYKLIYNDENFEGLGKDPEGKARLTILKREIKFETNSNSWVYDGNKHSDDGYSVKNGKYELVAGHWTEIDGEVPIVQNVLDTQKENAFAIKIYSPNPTNPTDVTANYDFSGNNTVYGTLTITPRKIIVWRYSASKTYDGLPLYNYKDYTVSTISEETNEINASTNYIVSGHKFNYIEMVDGVRYIIDESRLPNITEVEIGKIEGKIENTYNLGVYEGSQDMSDNYDITYKHGYKVGQTPVDENSAPTLTIKQRQIKVERYGDKKVYDGEPLIAPKFNIVRDDDPNDNVYEDIGIVKKQEIKYTPQQRTEAGETVINCKVEVYAGELSKTHNYNITYDNFDNVKDKNPVEDAKLVVERRRIKIITENEYVAEYDGKVHDDRESYTVINVVEGQHVHLIKWTELKDVYYENGVVSSKINEITFTIYKGDEYSEENDVWKNYLLEEADKDFRGTIKLTPVALEVHTGTYEKVYDGKEISYLTKFSESGYNIVGAIASGEKVEVVEWTHFADVQYEGETVVGKPNLIKIKIVYETGGDVASGNYVITYSEAETGTLTITPKKLENVPKFISGVRKIYDGTNIFKFEQNSDELVLDHYFSIKLELPTANAREYGEYPAVINIVNKDGESVKGNYLLDDTSTVGIEVLKRMVKVYTGSKETTGDQTLTYSELIKYEGEVKGHTFNATGGWATQVGVGSCDNTFTEFKVTDANGQDVSDNYAISDQSEWGRLKISEDKDAVIQVTVYNKTSVYDGKEYVPKSNHVVVKNITDATSYTASDIEFNYVFTKNGEIVKPVNVGKYSISIEITGGKFTDLENYQERYTVKEGTLTIKPATLTVENNPFPTNLTFEGENFDSFEIADAFKVQQKVSADEYTINFKPLVIKVWLDENGNANVTNGRDESLQAVSYSDYIEVYVSNVTNADIIVSDGDTEIGSNDNYNIIYNGGTVKIYL